MTNYDTNQPGCKDPVITKKRGCPRVWLYFTAWMRGDILWITFLCLAKYNNSLVLNALNGNMGIVKLFYTPGVNPIKLKITEKWLIYNKLDCWVIRKILDVFQTQYLTIVKLQKKPYRIYRIVSRTNYFICHCFMTDPFWKEQIERFHSFFKEWICFLRMRHFFFSELFDLGEWNRGFAFKWWICRLLHSFWVVG